MTADYRSLGIDTIDAAAFAAAAEAGIPGNLVIVRSADSGLAFEAACLAATSTLTGEHAILDLHRAAPDGDRWTIPEVDERVLRPARLKAFERTHVIVAEADQMTPAAYDHVLKTVEEPTSGAQFWFTLSDIDRLPVTLRGRSAAQFTLRPAPPAERLELLEAAGASTEHARSVAELAGDDVRLALAAAADANLLEALHTYRTVPLASTAPTADADRALAAVLRLAAALPSTTPTGADDPFEETVRPAKTTRKQKPAKASRKSASVPAKPAKSAGIRPRWDSLAVVARPDARRLVRRLLDRWTVDLVAQVASAGTAGDLARVEAALVAVHRAREELATNAPAATVLPALLARTNR